MTMVDSWHSPHDSGPHDLQTLRAAVGRYFGTGCDDMNDCARNMFVHLALTETPASYGEVAEWCQMSVADVMQVQRVMRSIRQSADQRLAADRRGCLATWDRPRIAERAPTPPRSLEEAARARLKRLARIEKLADIASASLRRDQQPAIAAEESTDAAAPDPVVAIDPREWGDITGNGIFVSGDVAHPNLRLILREVCRRYGLPRDVITSRRRFTWIVRPRQVYCYIASVLTPYTLGQIRRICNLDDHTTVHYAIRRIGVAVRNDPDGDIALAVGEIMDALEKLTNEARRR